MGRLWAGILAALVVATGCSSGGSGGATTLPAPLPQTTGTASPRHLTTIRTHGRVRIGVKFDLPLFGLKDPTTGGLSGFDIEIAKGITARLFPNDPKSADRIDFVEAISKNREKLLSSDAVDLVVSTYTINDARKQLVDFAGPYYIAGQDILAKQEDIRSGRIRGVGDVNGKRVCSVTGSTSLTNLRAAAPKVDTSITKDKYSQCFEALKEGQVEAMTTDDAILLGLAQGDPEFAITGNPFHTEPYGVGVPKGDDELRSFVNDALASMEADGSWTKAFQSTVGTTGAIAPTPPAVVRY